LVILGEKYRANVFTTLSDGFCFLICGRIFSKAKDILFPWYKRHFVPQDWTGYGQINTFQMRGERR